MDPVSRVLEERRRLGRPFLPFIVLAVGLHAAIVLGVALAARLTPHRAFHLPSVSVRLVTLPRTARPRHRGSGAKTRPARPRPTAVPKPSPPPVKPPEQAPEESRPEASAAAMAALETTAVGMRQSEPAAEDAGRGLSLAGSSTAGPPAIPSDFRFAYYVDRMLALIETRWYKPPVPAGTATRVRFRILTSGRLVDISLEASSGVPSFDRAALRALYAANPLPPLPPGYRKPSLTVHLAFSE